MKSALETSDAIYDSLTKLALLAEMSAAKGDGRHQLNAFHTISDAVHNIAKLQILNSDQILACVNLLKQIVALQQSLVRSKEIATKQIPQLYDIAHTLNTLFVKSSKAAIKSGDTATITDQCEALLQGLDELRSDASLRTCGILDAKLKNAVGKLREKADIMTLFQGEDGQVFAKVIQSAENELEKNDLAKIAATYAKLEQLNVKFKQKYPLKSNLNHYLVKFRDTLLTKIKERVSQLKKESAKGSLMDCRELLEQVEKLESLTPFHGDTAVDRQIRVNKNKILTEKILPLESVLEQTLLFIRRMGDDHFTMGYQEQYQKAHGEDEIFTTAFYRFTLAELPPRKAVSLLKEKREKMKLVEIQNAGQADFEATFRKRIGTLVKAFDLGVSPKNT